MIDIMATAREMAMPVRDATTIAQEINEIKDRVRETALDGAIEIGRRLCEVKAMVPVGSWGKWLQENVDYSDRTAQNLMAIYKEYGKKGIPEKLANVCLTNALALVGLPDDVKHELIESGMAEEASVRELKAEIARLNKEREEAQQSFLEQLELSQAAHQDAIDQLKACDEEMRDLRERALLAQQKAMSQAEQLAEYDQRRREAEEALRSAQTPATVVVEKDSEETLKRLAVLEARARESQESANVILFRERFAGFTEAYNRCLEQLELIAREDGDSGAAQFRRALGRAAAQMAQQMGG